MLSTFYFMTLFYIIICFIEPLSAFFQTSGKISNVMEPYFRYKIAKDRFIKRSNLILGFMFPSIKIYGIFMTISLTPKSLSINRTWLSLSVELRRHSTRIKPDDATNWLKHVLTTPSGG